MSDLIITINVQKKSIRYTPSLHKSDKIQNHCKSIKLVTTFL